jgi:hypothetical protein
MALTFNKPNNSSDPKKELIPLRTDEDMNLKGYAIIDRTFDEDGKPSNEFRHFYPFPNYEVKKNDVVVLITGKGNKGPDPVFQKGSGKLIYRIHYFFWGSEECVWNNNGGDTASLIKFTLEDHCIIPAVENHTSL